MPLFYSPSGCFSETPKRRSSRSPGSVCTFPMQLGPSPWLHTHPRSSHARTRDPHPGPVPRAVMFAPDRLLVVAVCRREADGSQTEPGTCSPRPCPRPTCLTVPSISVNGSIVSPQRTHTGNTILSSIASAAGLKATSPLLLQLTAWSAPRRGHQTRLFYRGRDVFMCASLPCTSGSAGAAWGLLGNADSQAPHGSTGPALPGS